MSSRAMILLQALVRFRDEAVAIFGKLLPNDDVEGELLELADPRQTSLARGEQLARREEAVDRRADEI